MRTIILAIFVLATAQTSAAAQVPADIALALQSRGVRADQVQAYYDLITQGLGRGVGQIQSQFPANPSVQRTVGEVLVRHRGPAHVHGGGVGFQARVTHIIRSMPHIRNQGATAFRNVLTSGQTWARSLQGHFTPGTISRLSQWAYRVGGPVADMANNAGGGSAAGGMGFMAYVQSSFRSAFARFGNAIGWGSMRTALTSLTGYMVVYGVSDYAISVALSEYEGAMNSFAYAAEANAYNNNVRLLIRALRDDNQHLPPGVTLGMALRKLRANMARGGSAFDGIFARQGQENPKPRDTGDGYFVVRFNNILSVRAGDAIRKGISAKSFRHGGISNDPAKLSIVAGPLSQEQATRHLAGMIQRGTLRKPALAAGRVAMVGGKRTTIDDRGAVMWQLLAELVKR